MSVKSLKTGSRSISMLAGNTPEHHVLIAETTVGAGGVSSVTFSNIPSTYQHLQIRGIARTTNASAVNLIMRVGSTGSVDTGSNYMWHFLQGDGASATSGWPGATSRTEISPGVLSADANIFDGFVIDLLDYSATSKNKTVRTLSGFDRNGSSTWLSFTSGLWMNTAAINVISLFGSSGNLAQYSTLSLYGVK